VARERCANPFTINKKTLERRLQGLKIEAIDRQLNFILTVARVIRDGLLVRLSGET